MKVVNTAVIGCGAISDIYLSNMMNRYATLNVTACSARHLEHAQKKAGKYGIRAMTVEEILADPEIELVVVLTQAHAHYELIRQALLAGKHVYTEKTMTTELHEAKELIALAAERGLRLGSAPETFMGSSFQTARQAMDAGLIGDVTSFHVVANRDLTLLASIFHFLREKGGGICFDYGVYYLTALLSLLGPAESVYAQVGNHQRVRRNVAEELPDFGQDYIYDNEAQVNAVLTLRSGVTGTFSLNGDSANHDQAYFTIHGTKGILQLGDANQFGGEVRYLKNDRHTCNWEVLEPVSPLSMNARGIGPTDMALCIWEGGEHLASGDMACHMLDVVERMIESGASGRAERMTTTFDRPEPFTRWDRILRK